MTIYTGDWAVENYNGLKDQDALCADFQIDSSKLKDCDVLLACYTYESYDGSAFVLFKKDDTLYEVVGGHCSCYGLEGQWEPEVTTFEALRQGLETRYEVEFCREQLRQVLDRV